MILILHTNCIIYYNEKSATSTCRTLSIACILVRSHDLHTYTYTHTTHPWMNITYIHIYIHIHDIVPLACTNARHTIYAPQYSAIENVADRLGWIKWLRSVLRNVNKKREKTVRTTKINTYLYVITRFVRFHRVF